MNETWVYIGQQAPGRRPVGDILVSTIDPQHWGLLQQLECEKHDEPGVLADAFAKAAPLNIAVAEAVTVDSGSLHLITLVCEPYKAYDRERVKRGVGDWADGVQDSLQRLGFVSSSVAPIYSQAKPLTWLDKSKVDRGWLRNTKWREHLQQTHPDLPDDIDLTTAVVSADTSQRVLRFVFPRRGARAVKVEHRDSPGALSTIAGMLAGAKFNILSALLRRGGAPPDKAILLAVVEPTPEFEGDVDVDVDSALTAAFRRLDPDWMPDAEILPIRDPNALVYPQHPDEVVARVPRELLPTVRIEQEKVPDDKTPIFLSRRFVKDDRRSGELLKELRAVLDEHGFHLLEGIPEPGSLTPSSYAVQAKMWISRACILLVTSTPDDHAFSVNLAHEAGFFNGQGKDLLTMVQRGASKEYQAAANFAGTQFAEFSRDKPRVRGLPGSIEAIVKEWLETL